MLATGWRSPMASDGNGCGKNQNTDCLDKQVKHGLATGWAAAAARDWRSGLSNLMDRNSRPLNEQAVMLAGWATPAAHEAGGTPEQFLDRKRRAVVNGSTLGISLTSLSLQAKASVMLTGWPTTTTTDARRGVKDPRPWDTGIPLTQMAALSGPASSGSPAATGSGAQLNPAFPLWLQGYPTEWLLSGVQAIA